MVFDEIQNAPELMAFVRTLIDAHPSRKGQWLFTGSQEAPLMKHVSESLAGRAAILQLLPLSARESPRVSMLSGGYPEAVARPRDRALYFSSFIQTYLERDIRAIINVKDLATFRSFLALVASRHGQVLNKTDLASPLGVSVPTIDSWLGALEITSQIILLPPYFENLGKRLTKSPKLYLLDSGLACHLLGLRSEAELERSPFLGSIFEGFVAGEIAKSQLNAGERREIYFFRDQQGLEVDFIVPRPRSSVLLVEAKATRTPVPEMAKPMLRLAGAFPHQRVSCILAHRPSKRASESTALAPGAAAYTTEQLVAYLNPA